MSLMATRELWWRLTSLCLAAQMGSGLVSYLALRARRWQALARLVSPAGYVAFVVASLTHLYVIVAWEYLTFNGCHSTNPDPSPACRMSHTEIHLYELFSLSNLLWPFVAWIILRPPVDPPGGEIVATLSHPDG